MAIMRLDNLMFKTDGFLVLMPFMDQDDMFDQNADDYPYGSDDYPYGADEDEHLTSTSAR